jgi:hypothetical protein
MPSGWSYVPFRQAFAAWGAVLEPGETSRMLPAQVPAALAPGRYRLTAHVTVLRDDGSPVRRDNGQPVSDELFADFTVG